MPKQPGLSRPCMPFHHTRDLAIPAGLEPAAPSFGNWCAFPYTSGPIGDPCRN